MKTFIKKYRISILTSSILFGIAIILIVVQLVFSVKSAKNVLAKTETQLEEKNTNDFWANSEYRNIDKQNLWLSNFLLVSKTDSIGLGINLKDSILQVQIKGIVLAKTRILKIKPENFLSNLSKEDYLALFGKPVSIVSEKSSIPRKPIKKYNSNEKNQPADTLLNVPFNWQFQTSNRLGVIINGAVRNDSVYIINQGSDLFRHRKANLTNDFFYKRFTPEFFIWIDESDAKVIYRALPENGKVIFMKD